MNEFPLTENIISELVRRVTDAQELMLKYEIEANTVILNNRKYAALVDNLKCYPTICGLKAEIAPLMDDVDFIVQRRPLTNADRIRAMSDEELAVLCEDGCPPHDHRCPDLEGEIGMKENCQRCWLEWLKQEAQCTSE